MQAEAARKLAVGDKKSKKRKSKGGAEGKKKSKQNDGKAAAAAVRCPRQVILAGKDRMAPRKVGMDLVKHLDGPELAIIEDSGSQLKVSEGDIVEIDPRERDDKDTIVFERVLAIGEGEGSARLGQPYLAGASVKAELVDEILGEKLHVIKYKRRKGYRRKIGHRQQYLRVKIASIEG